MAPEPLAMPTHDRVRLDYDQSRAPVRPRLREQHPKQPISRTQLRTSDRAPEDSQLLTQRHIFERDGPVSATDQPERSEYHEKHGQHA
jgi:hypothetical protein